MLHTFSRVFLSINPSLYRNKFANTRYGKSISQRAKFNRFGRLNYLLTFILDQKEQSRFCKEKSQAGLGKYQTRAEGLKLFIILKGQFLLTAVMASSFFEKKKHLKFTFAKCLQIIYRSSNVDLQKIINLFYIDLHRKAQANGQVSRIIC